MTDNDIIKALEHCVSSTGSEACEGCPFNENDICDKDSNATEKYALDLINRQKAQIDGLINGQETLQKYIAEQKAEIEELKEDNFIKSQKRANIFEITNAYERGRAEAITEFEERLCEDRVSNDPVVIAVKTELKMMKEGVNNA